MKKSSSVLIACSSLLVSLSLHAVTHVVMNNSSDPTVANSLPFFINNSSPGDTIDCSMIPGLSITLTQDLPAINKNLTLTSTSVVTINGNNLYQPFSIASGTVAMTNFNIINSRSIGGTGGNGLVGGGGGVGAGGGIYVHNGANLTINTVTFMNNQAIGGNGGNGGSAGRGGGGGGGGYAGGNGANATPGIGGGGGGGNSGGGAGGSGAAGTVNTNLTLAGGGGGANGFAGGAATFNLNGMPTTNAGGATAVGGGGGGAGVGGVGANATPTAGGAGGPGLGSDGNFGGGGGGGGAAALEGGPGFGAGGGGGGGFGAAGVGGAGGSIGGGGGGGQMTGGSGGFGGGGGGSTLAGGMSQFGGGQGGSAANADGGGGAGLGGSIFVQRGATITLNDGWNFAMGNAAGGTTGGTGGATAGQGLSNDIFLQSGGSLIFNLNATNQTIGTNIDSDNGAGGGTGGGLTMSGSKTLTLSGANTYSGTTTISSGTLSVSGDGNLGVAATPITINTGTLQVTGGGFSTSRTITLTGGATFDTPAMATNLILDGQVTGSGSFTKTGPGTLTITNPNNNFSNGATVSAGTLSIPVAGALGPGTLNIGAATFQITMPITFANNINLSAAATIDPQGNAVTLSGQISGGGSLTKIGAGALTLAGANSYSNGTTVNAGSLIGSTGSLQGNIQNNATVEFAQAFSGTYSGAMSGNGNLFIFGGAVQFTGNSSSFTGPTSIQSGQFIIDGSLSMSDVTVTPGTSLSGSGTVRDLTNQGTVAPGDGIGTLNLRNYTSALNSTLLIGISPGVGSLLNASGNVNLTNTNLLIAPTSGFFGVNATYTIVNSMSILGTQFATFNVTNPNFVPTLTYTPSQVILFVKILNPFLDFPFSNPNTKAVGNNIGELNFLGELDADLIAVIDGFAGGSIAAINNALDQMHPAPFSALAEAQADLGAQIASIFHRRPFMSCYCERDRNWWVEPFADWTRYDHKDFQVGFISNMKGIAFGIDNEFFYDNWVFGIGGAWNQGELTWHDRRGHADAKGWHVAAYTDYQTDNFYVGASVFGGLDTFDTERHMQFFTTNRTAHGEFNAVDIVGQLSSAYFFGVPACHFYPYLNADFLYLNQASVKEKDAGGLNLEIRSNTRSTFRGETGIGLQVQDTNYNQTMCVSPLVSLGYIIEVPIQRPDYVCNFQGEPLDFNIIGYDYTWQFFTVDFGLALTYKCFSLSGEYTYEISPESHGHEWAISTQKANIRLNYSW